MTTAPAAIVMLFKDLAYVTMRDYLDEDGARPSGENGKPPSRADGNDVRAIEPVGDKFGLDEIVDQWLRAVDQQLDAETGGLITGRDDVVGNMVLVGDTDSENERQRLVASAPHQPAMSLVKVRKEDDFVLVRWLAVHGEAHGQEFSVFAAEEDNAALFAAYEASLASVRGGGASTMTYETIRDAKLVPVYASITIPLPVVFETDAGAGLGMASDSAGEGLGLASDSAGEAGLASDSAGEAGLASDSAGEAGLASDSAGETND